MMRKIKKSNKVILLSALSALAFGGIAAGTTYALFTSTAETTVSVSTGKVNVTATTSDLKTYSGVDLTGDPETDTVNETAVGTFTNGGSAVIEGNTLKLTNITPGDKVTFNINVKNNSNVKTKYRTIIQKTDDDGLYSGLSISVDDNTWSNGFSVVSTYTELAAVNEETLIKQIPVTVSLPSDKGDDYKNKKCSIQISVEAVQGNAAIDDYTENDLTLYNSDDLYLLSSLVNSGSAVFDSYNSIYLTNDIALDTSKEWVPIAQGNRKSKSLTDNSKEFTWTFNGGNHTISNLKISDTTSTVASTALGFFGVVSGGTIKNLNFENVQLSTTKSENFGTVTGLLINGGTVENVNVKSGSISGVEGLGGLVGRMMVDGTIDSCTNRATITGTVKNIAGIVGAAYYTEQDKTMTISNCKNYGAISSGENGAYGIGGIVGFSAANISKCENTGAITNNGEGTSLGGIAGEQQNFGSIMNCTNSGAITGTSMGFGAGGIVGWVRYSGDPSAYARYGSITVSNNENSGNVNGGGSAGGIVGHLYNVGIVSDNKNTASSIKANTDSAFAAGIVGSFQHSSNGTYFKDDTSLTFTDNTSTTTLDNITGNCKALLIYDNTGTIHL